MPTERISIYFYVGNTQKTFRGHRQKPCNTFFFFPHTISILGYCSGYCFVKTARITLCFLSSLCISVSLSGPQWRDRLTLPQSPFMSCIPVENFRWEKSVNTPHRKTGVWPPRLYWEHTVVQVVHGVVYQIFIQLCAAPIYILEIHNMAYLNVKTQQRALITLFLPLDTDLRKCFHFQTARTYCCTSIYVHICTNICMYKLNIYILYIRI